MPLQSLYLEADSLRVGANQFLTQSNAVYVGNNLHVGNTLIFGSVGVGANNQWIVPAFSNNKIVIAANNVNPGWGGGAIDLRVGTAGGRIGLTFSSNNNAFSDAGYIYYYDSIAAYSTGGSEAAGLVIGVTNDGPEDVVAIEAAGHIYLNPGQGPNPVTALAWANTQTSQVYVGNNSTRYLALHEGLTGGVTLRTPITFSASANALVFSGATNTAITLRTNPNGILSFDGGAGSLLSIANTITGQLFSVNDISGFPILEVVANTVTSNTLIQMGQFGAKVSMGTNSTPNSTLTVTGNATITAIDVQQVGTNPGNLGYLRTPSGTRFTYNTTNELVMMNLGQLRITDGVSFSYDAWGGIRYVSANSTMIIGGPGAPGITNNAVVSANIVMHNASTGNFMVANTAGINMLIGANGNIGVGNVTPTHKMVVTGNVAITGTLVANASGGASGQALLANGTGGMYWGAAPASAAAGTNTQVQYNLSGTTTGAAIYYVGGNTGFGNTAPNATVQITGTANVSGTLTVGGGAGTSVIANTTGIIVPIQVAIGGGGATAEGAQIVLGYGNNLATAITGQANNTWNIDVIGGNTASTPLLRVFTQNGDGTSTPGFSVANTGRMHVGSVLEQTDSTFKVTGSANITTTSMYGGVASFTAGANAIVLTNGTSNYITWGTAGVTAPTTTTRSAGTKLVLYPDLSTTQNDYALGVESGHLWFTTGNGILGGFKWYANSVNIMTSNAAGLTLNSGQLNVGNSTVNSSIAQTTASIGANSTATALYVAANGNIGLGNSTPTYRLHVGASARVEGVFSAGGVGKFSVDAANFSDGRLVITTDPTGNATNFSPNANVGIGNSTPNAKLYVQGTANISANVWIGGSATIAGNLTISGTTTYINTTNLNVGDNIITLNADLGAVAPSENAGIEVNRGTSANVAIRWDESIDRWTATNDGTTYANIAIGAAGATLTANTTDSATYYLPMSNATSGNWTNAVVDSVLTFVPSTNVLQLTGGSSNTVIAPDQVKVVTSSGNTAIDPYSITIGDIEGRTARLDLTSLNIGGTVANLSANSSLIAMNDDAATLRMGNTSVNVSINTTSVAINGGNLTVAGVTQMVGIRETSTAPTISAGTLTLDLNTGTVFDVALTSNITTLTISNVATSGKVSSFILTLTADGTARTVVWPASFKWPNGTAPTLTATNTKKDAFLFFTNDGGTSWLSFVSGQNM